jgi:aspartate kinase
MKIFKFGGGILGDAKAIRHLPEVLKLYPETDMVIVISAFGKITNALEKYIQFKFEQKDDEAREVLREVVLYHDTILIKLCPDRSDPVFRKVEKLYQQMEVMAEMKLKVRYDEYYDRVIGFGEMLSSTVIHWFLQRTGFENHWLKAGDLVVTDSTFRDARVDFEQSKIKVEEKIVPELKKSGSPHLFITQGFIGADIKKRPTSLGREGSDYTAAIFGNLLDAEEVIIWKDVMGVLNADPRHFKETVKLERLSYSEATELAYYGAKVMHHKTVKPLRNKQIPLWVKPFWEPRQSGTLIHTPTDHDTRIPSFIFKFNQVLISVSTLDLSFIDEKVYHEVFGIFSRYNFHVNITQNSALTLSFCVDARRSLPDLLSELSRTYKVRYNEGLELITVRHYAPDSKEKVLQGRQVILEQQNRTVLQMVVR